jgi:hypothetical protein
LRGRFGFVGRVVEGRVTQSALDLEKSHLPINLTDWVIKEKGGAHVCWLGNLLSKEILHKIKGKTSQYAARLFHSNSVFSYFERILNNLRDVLSLKDYLNLLKGNLHFLKVISEPLQ